MAADLYKLLQIDPQAEPEIVEAAFRRLVRKYHPDVNPAPEARQLMQQIAAAYEILRDPERRAAFDRSRQAERGPVRRTADHNEPVDDDAAMDVSLLGGMLDLGLRLRMRRL